MPRPPTHILTKNNLRQTEVHTRDQLTFHRLSVYELKGSPYAVVSIVYYLGHKYKTTFTSNKHKYKPALNNQIKPKI